MVIHGIHIFNVLLKQTEISKAVWYFWQVIVIRIINIICCLNLLILYIHTTKRYFFLKGEHKLPLSAILYNGRAELMSITAVPENVVRVRFPKGNVHPVPGVPDPDFNPRGIIPGLLKHVPFIQDRICISGLRDTRSFSHRVLIPGLQSTPV